MLKTQEVVNFVNEKLNELGTEGGYSFDIHSNIGENRNNGALNGILYINQGNPMPIPDYVENDCNFVVEILVPSARANKQFDEVQNIISQFSKNYNGTNQVFDDGKGLLNITLGKPENFNISSNTGENVPLYFTISVLYTKGVKTSGDVHWLLENMEIPYLNDEIFVDREGNVNKQYTGSSYFAETKTLLTSQTTMFRFVFPFKNVIGWNGFFVDLLDADIDKEYELKYYDGYFYTQQNPYRTIVKVFKSARVGGQRGKAKTFDVTFAKVDNGQTSTKYFMALIDNPFDNQTEDTMWFEDVVVNGQVTQTAQQVQQAYFESKVANGCAYQQIKAPNLNSIDITSQIYPNMNGYDLFDTVNKNYAIIKVQSGTYDDSQVFTPLSTRYFYYFVTNAQIGAGDKILFDLKLDTFQTYMFDSDIQFSDTFIEKANLNRWVEVDENTVAFNGNITSDLFEREELTNMAKILQKRTKVSLNTFDNNETMKLWLDQNVLGWVYAFIEPRDQSNEERYTAMKLDRSANTSVSFSELKIQTENYSADYSHPTYSANTSLACICYPIYRFNYDENTLSLWDKIVMQGSYNNNTYNCAIDKAGFENFVANNGGYSFIYSVKVSIQPPFARKYNTTQPYTAEVVGSTNTLYIKANSLTSTDDITFQDMGKIQPTQVCGSTSTDTIGVYNPFIQRGITNTEEYTTSQVFEFSKSSIIGANKNTKFNPKLLGSDYFSLKVGDFTGQTFEYDLQKMNTRHFQLSYTEPLTADITKNYLRLKDATGLYIKETGQNFTGFTGNTDNSLAKTTTAYQTMLTNQKNYFLQNETQRQFDMWQGFGTSAFGAIGGVALGGPLGAAAVVGTGLTGVNAIINNEKSKIMENYVVDNVRSQPSNIQNVKGNAYLNFMSEELGVYVEEWSVLPYEKEIANDFMIKYGFTVNKFGNLKDYFDIRHYFNFVKAQVGTISGIALSNVARADLRQRIANGVRCWKQHDGEFVVDYDKENYEEWLDTEYSSYEAWRSSQNT